MTREKFIKLLDKEGYSYKIEGDKIVVTGNRNVELKLETIPPNVKFNNRWDVNFQSLKTLPYGVEFNNGGGVYLWLLETLPPDVEFNNKGDVSLGTLKTIPTGVKFNNGRNVYLQSLKTIHPDVEFNNKGYVDLRSLMGDGLIEGINPNTLLNRMIKRGIFL